MLFSILGYSNQIHWIKDFCLQHNELSNSRGIVYSIDLSLLFLFMSYYRRLFYRVSITAVGNNTNHGVQNVQTIYHYINSFVIDIQGKFEIEVKGWRKWKWTAVYGVLNVFVLVQYDCRKRVLLFTSLREKGSQSIISMWRISTVSKMHYFDLLDYL